MAVNINGDTGIDKVQPGTIDSADFGPGVITTPAIADSAVTAPKVAGVNGSAGQYLQSDGDGTMSWITAAAGGFSNMQVFTSPGTWTNPGTVEKVKVTVVGGGGNGGTAHATPNNSITFRSAGGGGGGGTAIEVIPFPSGTNVAVTVGGASGTSSFGAYTSATGGAAGATTSVPLPVTAGGDAGVGSGGSINFQGSDGFNGGGPSYGLGYGGNSFMGGGGKTAIVNTDPAVPQPNPPGGNNYGGGGAGAAWGGAPGKAPGGPGGAGAPGVVIVEY